MLVIILTGTIGSGKSTVAAILRELGAVVVDSDNIARHLIDPGTPAYHKVIEAFGESVLGADKVIDRKKLAERVFNNRDELMKLNNIIHPGVDEMVEAVFEKSLAEGKKAVFVEMAFLAGPRWKNRVDRFWVVQVSRKVALKRLASRGLSRAEALARLANQPDPRNIVKKGLTIINNNGSLDELSQQVVKLWQNIDNESE